MPESIALFNLSQGNYGSGDIVYEPLGCLYLISAARKAGYDVCYEDLQLAEFHRRFALSVEELWENTCAQGEHVLGISCMSALLPLALVLAEHHKKRHPSAKVVLGGPGPSAVADELVKRHISVDYVIAGEGERSFVSLLQALDGGESKSIDGGSRVLQTKLEPNIDGIPFPDRTLVADGAYSTCILGARGCPYDCIFCALRSLWGKGVRRRSPENVIAELLEIRRTVFPSLENRPETDLLEITIIDDTFAFDRRWLARFGALLEKHSLSLAFRCYATIDSMKEEALQLLKELGCNSIHVGVESGSARVLKRVGKRYGPTVVLDRCRLAKEIIGSVSASFIYGFPFEEDSDVKKTIDLIRQVQMNGVETILCQLTTFRGTELHRSFPRGYELNEGVLYEQLSSPCFATEVVEKMVRHVTLSPDMFVNFCDYPESRLEEKKRLVRGGLGFDGVRI